MRLGPPGVVRVAVDPQQLGKLAGRPGVRVDPGPGPLEVVPLQVERRAGPTPSQGHGRVEGGIGIDGPQSGQRLEQARGIVECAVFRHLEEEEGG